MSNDDTAPFRQRGRPPVSANEPSYQVSTRLPERTHDRLLAIASQRGQTVAEVLRSIVVFQLRSS